MTDAPPPTRVCPAWFATLVFAAAAAALLVAAAKVMFSAFMFYDDEGYVLLSLRNFAEHGGLYREVYTQYGPFPFVFHSALHALGLPFTHTTGRLITLGAWGGTALLAALLAGWVTRSLAARLVVLAAVFAYLWVMASEPTHPGGLIVLLTTALAVLGHHWLTRDHVRAWALLAGAVTAALLLTKINIGLFAAFSAGAWLLLHHRSIPVHRWAPILLAIASAVFPFALMRPLLAADWVQTFALAWACAAMALLRTISIDTEGRADGATLGWGMLGAAAVGALVLGATLARGSSLSEIWHGVVLAPLQQPTVFNIRYLWAPGTRLVALASLGLCVLACRLRRRHPTAIDTGIALARLAAAAALAVNLARFPFASPDYLVFGFALPCLWLFAWPLAGDPPGTSQARAWVLLVLLGQCLHVFPVAGSQIAWGTLLALPLAAIGAWDAAAWLLRQFAGTLAASRRRTISLAGAALALVFAATMGWKFQRIGTRHRIGQDLGLPGAEMVRLPDGSAALFRLLTYNAVAHADLLFSEPGMFSFNLWSGLPTPTRANVTHWFSLLSPDRQQAIIRQLEAHPRACVILHREHLEFLKKRGHAPAGPLHDYIAREFAPAFAFDHFEFLVRRGRRLAPFLVAELLTHAGTAGPAPAGEDSLLRFSLLLPVARPVAQIELASPVEPTAASRFLLDAANARAEIVDLNPRGEPRAAPRPAAWPLANPGPSAFALYYDRQKLPPPPRGAVLILRDAAGREVALGRLHD